MATIDSISESLGVALDNSESGEETDRLSAALDALQPPGGEFTLERVLAAGRAREALLDCVEGDSPWVLGLFRQIRTDLKVFEPPEALLVTPTSVEELRSWVEYIEEIDKAVRSIRTAVGGDFAV